MSQTDHWPIPRDKLNLISPLLLTFYRRRLLF